MSYPWAHHGHVRIIAHRWVEPVRKPDPHDKNLMVDDYETEVEIYSTDTFQFGFVTTDRVYPSWVADEISEFGADMVKNLLEPESWAEIWKADQPKEIPWGNGRLKLTCTPVEPLPEHLPSDCVVEIVGEFWYWGGMTFNGESEEYDCDSEIRKPQVRILTEKEAKFWEPCDGTNCRKSCCKPEMVQLK